VPGLVVHPVMLPVLLLPDLLRTLVLVVLCLHPLPPPWVGL
jgi:hypothetical protein